MNKITIDGQDLYFINHSCNGSKWVNFYKKYKQTPRQFLWFKWFSEQYSEHTFQIPNNIIDYSKTELREMVGKKLALYLQRENRKKEIEEGEII